MRQIHLVRSSGTALEIKATSTETIHDDVLDFFEGASFREMNADGQLVFDGLRGPILHSVEGEEDLLFYYDEGGFEHATRISNK